MATAARQATSTTSATASYSSQCKLFANITVFRRREPRQITGKGSQRPIYLTIYRRQRIRPLYQCNLGLLLIIYRLTYRLNDDFRSRLLVVGKVNSYSRVLTAIRRTMVSRSTSTTNLAPEGLVPAFLRSEKIKGGCGNAVRFAW